MATVRFADDAAFTAWHDAKCAEKGIPHPGYNAETGALALDAQWTTAWIEPVKIDGALCVRLPDEEIAADATLSKLARVDIKEPVTIDATVDKNGDPISTVEKVTFRVAKPLPAKWTGDGIEYDVPTTLDAAVEADIRKEQ